MGLVLSVGGNSSYSRLNGLLRVEVRTDEFSLSLMMGVEAGFSFLSVLSAAPGLHLSVQLARRKPPCTIRQISQSVHSNSLLFGFSFFI